MTLPEVEKPVLSVIVIFHNMVREADRTLRTLAEAYQAGVSAADYEIIAIDNGSSQPLSADRVAAIGTNIRYHFMPTDSVSPADAVNLGVEMARGMFVGLIVDGARMVTPGLIGSTISALRGVRRPFVCALAWHLGPDVQNRSMSDGYDATAEDALLASIDWHTSGYRLFEISTLAQSSAVGFLGGLPSECSWLAMPRDAFKAMGGFDTRFKTPGGGLVNHDFLKRVMADRDTNFVVLLGEGSFHQVHGGIATNCPPEEHPMRAFQEEYRGIHGESYVKPRFPEPFYFGSIPPQAMRFVKGRHE
ncbi:MAG: glycosyltransferase family 2 protein [Jhaorihella sp.]